MWKSLMNLRSTLRDRRGVTALEYGVIAALILVVIIGAVTIVGNELNETFSSIGSSLTAANAR